MSESKLEQMLTKKWGQRLIVSNIREYYSLTPILME